MLASNMMHRVDIAYLGAPMTRKYGFLIQNLDFFRLEIKLILAVTLLLALLLQFQSIYVPNWLTGQNNN